MKSQEKKIAIPCCKSYDFELVKNIVRCEGLQNYTRIFLSSGEMLISSSNIGVYKKCLKDFGFFCCHKSHVINVNHIKKFFKEGYIEMVDTSSVPLSRRRKGDFLKQIINKYDISSNNN